MLKIERLESGAITVLRLEGDIYQDEENNLRLVLAECIKDQRFNVVVNLEAVTFISYMGVGALVERLRQLQGFGGDLKLVAINMYTERLFRMMGVKNFFKTFKTESQAITAFQEAA